MFGGIYVCNLKMVARFPKILPAYACRIPSNTCTIICAGICTPMPAFEVICQSSNNVIFHLVSVPINMINAHKKLHRTMWRLELLVQCVHFILKCPVRENRGILQTVHCTSNLTFVTFCYSQILN